MPAIQELRERRFGLATRMRELSESAEQEDRGLNGDEESERRNVLDEYDRLGERIERLEADEERNRDLATVERNPALIPGGEAAGDERAGEYAQVFDRYVRFGVRELSSDENRLLRTGFVASEELPAQTRALATGSGAAGGFTIPQGFLNRLVETRSVFGGMRQVADVITTDTGADLPFPTTDDTGEVGELLAENTAASEGDATFGQKMLRAYVISSKLVRAPLQLLQDSSLDIEGHLGGRLGRRIGRSENQYFTTGTGSAQPEGFLTIVPTGKTGASGQTTTVLWTDLVDLEHSVDRAYRGGARWMLNDQTLSAIKQLLDGNGRPLWMVSTREGEPDRINGYPYTVNNDLPVMAASAKSIAFGDFGQYVIRDVRGVQLLRLEERYAEYLQVGFLAFARVDGILADASAIKVYQNAAS